MSERGHLGPTIPVCVGTLLGGLSLAPIFREYGLISYVFVFSVSLLSGLIYRFLTLDFPIDPTARKSRYFNAMLLTFLLPILTAMFTGMDNGEAIFITQRVLLLGVSIAVGILVSGDRRPP